MRLWARFIVILMFLVALCVVWSVVCLTAIWDESRKSHKSISSINAIQRKYLTTLRVVNTKSIRKATFHLFLIWQLWMKAWLRVKMLWMKSNTYFIYVARLDMSTWRSVVVVVSPFPQSRLTNANILTYHNEH